MIKAGEFIEEKIVRLKKNKMKIKDMGCGYIELVSGTGFAEFGNIDKAKKY
jgi:hypothetical protein